MTHAPQIMTAWTEIPVSDLDKGIAFYTSITGVVLEKMDMGPNVTAVFRTDPPMKGAGSHLYVGKPASGGNGPTIHLSVEGTVEQAMERVKQAGGTVVSPAIDIPDGRFAYAIDPDGNSIGLFEAKAA